MDEPMENAIAIIGMSGKFPGAEDLETFWKNLCEGKESLSTFSDEELTNANISESQLQAPRYVKTRGILNRVEEFDADFFGMPIKEAQLTDPQHRFFLECAWEAMENAGYCPDRYPGSVGVYGGTSRSTYLLHHLVPNQKLMDMFGEYLIRVGNEKDFLTTRVSYKLNLKGPSLSIQTACSTSLAAICVACNHLLTYQCDLALAGGTSIFLPQISGYRHLEEMIFSPDGHCRPFDAAAKGTVPSNGAGVIVLKRLEDALADRDHIYAVIRGYGMNNDGSEKIGYSAPSVSGQTEAIKSAIGMAGIDPATITYVEAHGTGTLLGDPIEIEALTQAFQQYTQRKEYCAIGSVKSNIGHTMEASGIAGLMKVVLSLQNRTLPPSLHYQTPNPNIDFKHSPFYLNTELQKWKPNNGPLRAGVSSFGIGGTNAHLILEEKPAQISSPILEGPYLLVLSAKTPSALKTMATNLAKHLQTHPELSLSDVAYTLQMGRKEFAYRKAMICRDLNEAISSLLELDTNSEPQQNPILDAYAKSWLSGATVDWMTLYKQRKPHRIPLPTYPFEKKRYWIDPPSPQKEEPPVLQKNSIASSIEMTLLSIWKEYLGSEKISTHDDFFALGGDSLLAIQILSKIETEFGASLPLQTFHQFPTIAQLALAITQRRASEHPNVIPLRSGKGNQPLFLIHAIDGNVFSYKPLIECLTFPGPIFGIQSTHWEAPPSIEEMASFYVREIQKIQPQGPYLLFGSSFGGLIAYEMARRIKESGSQVAFLGMLDILHPQDRSISQKSDLEILTFLIELLEGKEIPIALVQSLSANDLTKLVLSSMGLQSLPLVQQQKTFEQIKRHLKAIQTYRPQAYEGKISFFQMRERFFRNSDLSLGTTWKELAKGGIEIIELEGNHRNMMAYPQIAALGKHLEICLNG